MARMCVTNDHKFGEFSDVTSAHVKLKRKPCKLKAAQPTNTLTHYVGGQQTSLATTGLLVVQPH